MIELTTDLGVDGPLDVYYGVNASIDPSRYEADASREYCRNNYQTYIVRISGYS